MVASAASIALLSNLVFSLANGNLGLMIQGDNDVSSRRNNKRKNKKTIIVEIWTPSHGYLIFSRDLETPA